MGFADLLRKLTGRTKSSDELGERRDAVEADNPVPVLTWDEVETDDIVLEWTIGRGGTVWAKARGGVDFNVLHADYIEFTCVGTSFREEKLQSNAFAPGAKLTIRPDPNNPHDADAIDVRDASGSTHVGFVPAEKKTQRILHDWLESGEVHAVVARDWDDDDGPNRRGGFAVFASPRRFVSVERIPSKGESDYDAFTDRVGHARGQEWPGLREDLLAETRTDDVLDRHFALQHFVEEAYKRRDDHPEALDDAIEACQEALSMQERAARAWRAEFPSDDLPEGLPAHHCGKQLAIIHEKAGRLGEAVAICETMLETGWNGDWDKRLTRLREKASQR